jgi:hypothetical protein
MAVIVTRTLIFVLIKFLHVRPSNPSVCSVRQSAVCPAWNTRWVGLKQEKCLRISPATNNNKIYYFFIGAGHPAVLYNSASKYTPSDTTNTVFR